MTLEHFESKLINRSSVGRFSFFLFFETKQQRNMERRLNYHKRRGNDVVQEHVFKNVNQEPETNII